MTGKGATIDVGAWLRDLGLGQYEAVFRENEIDIDILPELTEPHLVKLGMPLGHRIRLLKAISNLEASEKSAAAVAPAPEPLPHSPGPPIPEAVGERHLHQEPPTLQSACGLSYNETDPTIASQIVTLKASGADTFYIMATPKFAAQAIRKASEIGWKPLRFLSFVSHSISAVLEPAGLENSIGIISGFYAKDPTDPQWADDAYTREFLGWLQSYHSGGGPSDIFAVLGYDVIQPLIYLLEQCGDDLSRENIMHEAESFHQVRFPWLLPGITLNTSRTDHQPIKDMRETRFNGKTWELLDDLN
jgi:SAM domain (Sterile alpha motif)/Periplasmic binding protein